MLPQDRGASWESDSNDDVGEYKVTLTATGPHGVEASSVLTLTVIPDCTVQVISLPSTAIEDQFYTVRDPMSGYSIEAFGNTEPVHCPLTYTFSFDVGVGNDWLEVIAERELSWYTD